jgi:hypothetical protein
MKELRTRIDIRCTPKEKELLQEMARETGYTVSEYVRVKLFGRKVTVRLSKGKEPREVK